MIHLLQNDDCPITINVISLNDLMTSWSVLMTSWSVVVLLVDNVKPVFEGYVRLDDDFRVDQRSGCSGPP